MTVSPNLVRHKRYPRGDAKVGAEDPESWFEKVGEPKEVHTPSIGIRDVAQSLKQIHGSGRRCADLKGKQGIGFCV